MNQDRYGNIRSVCDLELVPETLNRIWCLHIRFINLTVAKLIFQEQIFSTQIGSRSLNRQNLEASVRMRETSVEYKGGKSGNKTARKCLK